MKWKGRPQSKNIQDRRNAPVMTKSMTIEHIIKAAEEQRHGKKSGGSQGKRKKPTGSRTGGGF